MTPMIVLQPAVSCAQIDAATRSWFSCFFCELPALPNIAYGSISCYTNEAVHMGREEPEATSLAI